MDLLKTKVFLDKINREYARMSKDPENIVRLDVDIMLSYVRDLYDALLSEPNSSPAVPTVPKEKQASSPPPSQKAKPEKVEPPAKAPEAEQAPPPEDKPAPAPPPPPVVVEPIKPEEPLPQVKTNSQNPPASFPVVPPEAEKTL